MDDLRDSHGARHQATFHAKVAGAQAMVEMTAEMAAPAVRRGDLAAANIAVESLGRAPGVLSVRLEDAQGRAVATYGEPAAPRSPPCPPAPTWSGTAIASAN